MVQELKDKVPQTLLQRLLLPPAESTIPAKKATSPGLTASKAKRPLNSAKSTSPTKKRRVSKAKHPLNGTEVHTVR